MNSKTTSRGQDNPPPQRRLWRKFIQSSFLRYQYRWKNAITPILPLNQFANPDIPNQSYLLPNTLPKDSTRLHHETIDDHIRHLPRWHRRRLSSVHQVSHDLDIWKSFRSKKPITIATDGGLATQVGTIGWIMVNSTDMTLFKGSGPIDSPIDINSSTRSELGGLNAPLLLFILLARHWGLKHRCRFTWVVKLTAAISKVTFTTTLSQVKQKYPDNVDYLSTIKALYRELKRPIRATWVKVHQDDSKTPDKLTRYTITRSAHGRAGRPHDRAGGRTRHTPSLPYGACAHVSNLCLNPSPGNQTGATFAYMQNGSTAYCYWLPS